MRVKTAVEEFLASYFTARNRARKTAEAYGLDLRQFAAFAGARAEVESVDARLVGRWAASLRGRHRDSSVGRKLRVLKIFCGHWVRKGVMPESPFWRLELVTSPRPAETATLTRAEAGALVRAARAELRKVGRRVGKSGDGAGIGRAVVGKNFLALRNVALIELLLETGMKVGEVRALDVGDFEPAESYFRVAGKEGRDRDAFVITKEAAAAQREYLRVREALEVDSAAFFINAFGDRLSGQGVSNVIARLCRASSVRRAVTAEVIRHTVEERLLESGVDTRVVLEFLGKTTLAPGRGLKRGRPSSAHVMSELGKRVAA